MSVPAGMLTNVRDGAGRDGRDDDGFARFGGNGRLGLGAVDGDRNVFPCTVGISAYRVQKGRGSQERVSDPCTAAYPFSG